MKQITFNQAFIRMFTLITLCFATFGFTTNFGLDSYEIYLNNKLILKQTVNQPLSLRVLQLGKVKANDQLRINYTHCMTKEGGTNRSIALKDEKGNILKKWTFADNSDLSMSIGLKDLLQLGKAHADSKLSIHYTAKELPKDVMLSMLNF